MLKINIKVDETLRQLESWRANLRNRMLDAVRASARESCNLIRTKGASLTDHTLADLATLGHPYRGGEERPLQWVIDSEYPGVAGLRTRDFGPRRVHGYPNIIHIQSGTFVRSLETSAELTPTRAKGKVTSSAPHSWAITLGRGSPGEPRAMIGRNIGRVILRFFYDRIMQQFTKEVLRRQ